MFGNGIRKILRFKVINTYPAARAIADDIIMTLTVNRYRESRFGEYARTHLETFMATIVVKSTVMDWWNRSSDCEGSYNDDEVCQRIITIYKYSGNHGSKTSFSSYCEINNHRDDQEDLIGGEDDLN